MIVSDKLCCVGFSCCPLLPAKPIGSHLLGLRSYPKPDSKGASMGRRKHRLFWNILAVCLWASGSLFGCCSADLLRTVVLQSRCLAACTQFPATQGGDTLISRNHVATSQAQDPGWSQPLMWWRCVGLVPPQAALKPMALATWLYRNHSKDLSNLVS